MNGKNGKNRKPFEQERDQQRSEKGQNGQRKYGQEEKYGKKNGCDSCKKNASYSKDEMNPKHGNCCNKNDYEDIDE